MKIFVTGASGFIGGRLAQKLAARGDTVVCLVRDPSKVKTNAALPNLQWVRGDVTEPATFQEAMRGADAVFHLAGMYKFGPKFIPQMRAINVDGARNVLQSAAELGVPKIIHTSTVGVFGNTHHKIVDEAYMCSESDMSSEYEKTKWEAHYQVAVPLQQQGAPVIITQPGLVVGPNDPSPHTSQYDFYFNRIPIGFGANSGTCWAHVDDTADGHIAALERGKFEAYCISGEPLTWKQAMEMWAPLTGIPAPKFWAPNWLTAFNQKLIGAGESVGVHMPFAAEGLSAMMDYTFWATNAKAQRELDWHPRSTQQLMRDLMDYEMNKRGLKPAPKKS